VEHIPDGVLEHGSNVSRDGILVTVARQKTAAEAPLSIDRIQTAGIGQRTLLRQRWPAAAAPIIRFSLEQRAVNQMKRTTVARPAATYPSLY
jgi:hypothetical protein